MKSRAGAHAGTSRRAIDFTIGKHSKGTEPLSKHLTEEQLRDAWVYLVNHAVDSPQPETCGKN